MKDSQYFGGSFKPLEIMRQQNFYMLVGLFGAASCISIGFFAKSKLLFAQATGFFGFVLLILDIFSFYYANRYFLIIDDKGKVIISRSRTAFYNEINTYKLQEVLQFNLSTTFDKDIYYYDFTFDLKNVKKAYLVNDQKEKEEIENRIHLDPNSDPTPIKMFWVTNTNKTVCIQFNTSLEYRSLEDIAFENKKPTLDKIYVSFNSPEEVIRALSKRIS
jgi:hypothetical protein